MGTLPPQKIGEERTLFSFSTCPVLVLPFFPGWATGSFGRIIPVHFLIRASLRGLYERSRSMSCSLSSSAQVLLRSTRVVVMVSAMLSVLVSCSEQGRRMGEREALDFRRNLVRRNYGDLSPAQRSRIMYHPSRTKREVRVTLDGYVRETAERRTREAAEFSGRARTGAQQDAPSDGSEPSGDDPVPEDSTAGEPATGESSGD